MLTEDSPEDILLATFRSLHLADDRLILVVTCLCCCIPQKLDSDAVSSFSQGARLAAGDAVRLAIGTAIVKKLRHLLLY
jgi:hypothetical protein